MEGTRQWKAWKHREGQAWKYQAMEGEKKIPGRRSVLETVDGTRFGSLWSREAIYSYDCMRERIGLSVSSNTPFRALSLCSPSTLSS